MNGNKRWHAVAVVLLLAVVALGGGTTVTGHAASDVVGAQLDLRGELRLVSRLTACPAPAGPPGACASRTSDGLVAGLGRVSVAYTWRIGIDPPSCDRERAKTLAYGVVLVVAGKGEIRTALSEADCVDLDTVRSQAQPFTVVGGTGVYTGASGAGTVTRSLAQTASGAVGVETWSGALEVPGAEFDVTRPTLSARSRTVLVRKKTRQVRVTYRVGAVDDVDGELPASCAPRSGTRFPVGRTTVRCSAVDTSGNVGTTRFVVTVKQRRA